MPLHFTSSKNMTLGVEIELQLVDKNSADLVPKAVDIFKQLGKHEKHIKPEIFQSMVEINTGICNTIDDVRRDLTTAINKLRGICAEIDVELVSAGSHPFAKHRERILYPASRYEMLIDRNRWVAQRLMIFGLHVHVGMRSGDHAIAMMNAISHYYPHLLALSASSPYWQGSDTGLASSRITIFEALPTAGHPCLFNDWKGFESFYDAMIRSKGIKSIKDIWWDIRPHPDFGTLEIRICDALPTLSETLSLVALIHCLLSWADQQYTRGYHFDPPPDWLLRENKWRASRWGMEALVVVDAKGKTQPLEKDLSRVVDMLQDTARSLGCERELLYIHQIMRNGISYQRQRRVFESGQSLSIVIASLIEEFKTDQPTVI